MSFIVDGDKGGFFPSWTTATRPASPAVGQMGYNTTTGQFDAYTSNGWVSVATSGNAPVNGPAFFAYGSANQSFTTGTFTKVTLDVETFDTAGCFASSRFTPTVAGYYQFNGVIFVAGTGNSVTEAEAVVYKNGAAVTFGSYSPTSGVGVLISNVNTIVYMNGTTDYAELYGYGSATSPYFRYTSSSNSCQFSGALIRAA